MIRRCPMTPLPIVMPDRTAGLCAAKQNKQMKHSFLPAAHAPLHPVSPRGGLGIHRNLAALCVAVSLTLSSGLAQQLEQGSLAPRPKTEVSPSSEIQAVARKADEAYAKLASIGPELDKAIQAFERDPSEANAQALDLVVAKNCAKASQATGALAEAKREAGRLAARAAKQCGSDAQLLRQAEGDVLEKALGYQGAFQAGSDGLKSLARNLRERGITNDTGIAHADRVRIYSVIKETDASGLAHKWLANAAESTTAARRHLEGMVTKFSEQSDWFAALADGFAVDQRSFILMADTIGKTTAAVELSRRHDRELAGGATLLDNGFAAQKAISAELARIPVPASKLTPKAMTATPAPGLWQQLLRFVGLESEETPAKVTVVQP